MLKKFNDVCREINILKPLQPVLEYPTDLSQTNKMKEVSDVVPVAEEKQNEA